MATTYYLGPNGENRTDNSWGRSTSKPWATFEYALPRLEAGDTLLVAAGEYEGCSITSPLKAGKSDNKITVQGDSNWGTWVKCNQEPFHVEDPTWWEFRYINVDGANYTGVTDHMIKFEGGHDWLWEKSEFRYNPNPPLGSPVPKTFKSLFLVTDGSDPANNWTIRRCWLHGNRGSDVLPNEDHCLYVSKATNGTIDRCIFSDAPNGRGIKLGLPSNTGEEYPAGCKVQYCTFVNCPGPSPTTISYSAKNNTWDHCVMVGPSDGVDTHEPTYPAIRESTTEANMNNKVQYCYAWMTDGLLDSAPTVIKGSGNVEDTDPKLNNRFEPVALKDGSGNFTHGHLYKKNSYTKWLENSNYQGPHPFRFNARFRRLRR